MEYKQALIVRSDLGMGKGKIAAQCAHASVQAVLEAQNKAPDALESWMDGGCAKIVLKVTGEAQLHELYVKAKKLKLISVIITDAGHTQIDPGTTTVVAIGPAATRDIDAVTSGLKLL